MFIIEFINNNDVLIFMNVLSFYTNKEFHFYINFNSDLINYNIIRKRLNAIKIKNIINYI